MSLLSLSEVEVSFGAEDVIQGVTCDVNAGDRIGLIGRNGAGKTTLLQVLAGELTPTSGRRQVARNTRIALVQQVQAEAASGATVREEALAALQHLVDLERDLAKAAEALSAGAEAAVERYAELHERLENERGFNYPARLAEVLTGLGLPEPEWDRPVSQLSGGQRSRLALAKALLAEPAFLLMDEPTNHLDMDALQWLDGFLARWPGTFVVTSHDRYFLDRVANQIWLMTSSRLATYKGNYTKSEAQRHADLERQQRQFEAQQEFIAKEQDFIRRYGAGQRAREAQGRQKRLARLERIEAPTKERSASITFKAQRSGDMVLATKELAAGYGRTPILAFEDLEVVRGDRIALLGPNGAGKTTLLRTLAGELPPVSGSLRLGARVKVAHYWQEAEDLDASGTVLDEALGLPNMQLQEARNLLGSFLFRGDDVFKSITALSGGERSRLALAKLTHAESNLLLLDEPTNHLDIPSRESLEAALRAYPGTLIFASHDRRLITEIATRLWIIRDGRLTSFNGGFDEYLESLSSSKAIEELRRPVAMRPAARTNRDKEKAQRLVQLEAEIQRREEELVAAGEAINAASNEGDLKAIESLGRRFSEMQTELDGLLARWMEESG